MRLLLLLLLSPVIVIAQDSRDYHPQFLVEIGLGSSEFTGDYRYPVEILSPVYVLNLPVTSPFEFDDGDSVANVSVAYRVWRNLYVDLGYSDLGEYQPTFPRRSCVTNDDCESVFPRTSIEQLSLGVRYYIPLTGRLSVLGRLGLTSYDFDTVEVRGPYTPIGFTFNRLGSSTVEILSGPEGDTGATVGVGLLLNLSERFGFGLNYNYHDVEIGTVEAIDLSLNVAF